MGPAGGGDSGYVGGWIDAGGGGSGWSWCTTGARGGTSIGGGPRIDANELLDRGSRRGEAQVDASKQTELGVWVALGGRAGSVRRVVKCFFTQ